MVVYVYTHAHTPKELEKAGFGEVFNSPLFEVEEGRLMGFISWLTLILITLKLLGVIS